MPDDIAWIDGTEIGLGEELYLTRVPSGDTVQQMGTASDVVAGELEIAVGVSAETVCRGESLFCPDSGNSSFEGSGRAFIAAT